MGLSLALKATDAGLIGAIACVVMNTVLRRRVTELMTIYKGHMERELDQINVIPLVDFERLHGYGKNTTAIVRAGRMILLERFVDMVNDLRRIGIDQVSLQVRL